MTPTTSIAPMIPMTPIDDSDDDNNRMATMLWTGEMDRSIEEDLNLGDSPGCLECRRQCEASSPEVHVELLQFWRSLP